LASIYNNLKMLVVVNIGQYLQQLKNAGFCKYWPDDGLFRPKLAADNINNKIKR